jgi:hypothetical protein
MNCGNNILANLVGYQNENWLIINPCFKKLNQLASFDLLTEDPIVFIFTSIKPTE